MTTGTVFGIVSILVIRITKAGYGWKANEFLFTTILRHLAFIVYRVFLETTKVGKFFGPPDRCYSTFGMHKPGTQEISIKIFLAMKRGVKNTIT